MDPTVFFWANLAPSQELSALSVVHHESRFASSVLSEVPSMTQQTTPSSLPLGGRPGQNDCG